VVTAFFNLEVDDYDIYMSLPECCEEVLNAPMIVVRINDAQYTIKQDQRLWHNNLIIFWLSLEFTQSVANPNLYLRGNGILMLLYAEHLSMLYPEEVTKAEIDIKASLSENT
jgi:hypothetical protein